MKSRQELIEDAADADYHATELKEEVLKLRSENEELRRQLDTALADIATLENPWVSIEQRLPEFDGIYLCAYEYDTNRGTGIFSFENGEFNGVHRFITHWTNPIELPEVK